MVTTDPIAYRFFDYMLGHGRTVRTVHVPDAHLRQTAARRLQEEQAALPEGSRLEIHVLGVANEYPAGWDPTVDPDGIVDNPFFVWEHGAVAA